MKNTCEKSFWVKITGWDSRSWYKGKLGMVYLVRESDVHGSYKVIKTPGSFIPAEHVFIRADDCLVLPVDGSELLKESEKSFTEELQKHPVTVKYVSRSELEKFESEETSKQGAKTELDYYMEGEYPAGMIPFKMQGNLVDFEDRYSKAISLVDLENSEERTNLLSAIWQLANYQWMQGKRWAEQNSSVYPEFISRPETEPAICPVAQISVEMENRIEWAGRVADQIWADEQARRDEAKSRRKWWQSLACNFGFHSWAAGWDEVRRRRNYTCQWCDVSSRFDDSSGHTHLSKPNS